MNPKLFNFDEIPAAFIPNIQSLFLINCIDLFFFGGLLFFFLGFKIAELFSSPRSESLKKTVSGEHICRTIHFYISLGTDKFHNGNIYIVGIIYSHQNIYTVQHLFHAYTNIVFQHDNSLAESTYMSIVSYDSWLSSYASAILSH